MLFMGLLPDVPKDWTFAEKKLKHFFDQPARPEGTFACFLLSQIYIFDFVYTLGLFIFLSRSTLNVPTTITRHFQRAVYP